MAISYNTGTTAFLTNSGTASKTLTIPAGVLSGDTVFVLFFAFTTATGTLTLNLSSTATTPVQVGSQVTCTGNSIIAQSALFRIAATGSDPGATLTATVTGGTGGAYWFNIGLVSYTGANAATPVDVSNGNSQFLAGTGTVTTPSLTTTVNNDWQVQFAAVGPPSGNTFTSFPGTQRQAINNGGTNAGLIMMITDSNGTVGSSGTSIGGGTFTAGAASGNAWITSFAVGLEPAATGTQTTPVVSNPSGFLYPLNRVSKRFPPQNPSVFVASSVNVNVNGLVANENVVSNFGGMQIFSPQNIPAPFAGNAPYPLNIIRKIKPNNPANRPNTYVPGITATVNVQANFGSVKNTYTGTPSNVSVASNFGTVFIKSVTQFGNPSPVNKPYPLSVIGNAKSLMPQNPGKPNTFVSGLTANVSVAASFGSILVFKPTTTTTPSVPIASYPFRLTGRAIRQQNSYVTFSPPSGISITGLTATVNVQANFGTLKITGNGISSAANSQSNFGTIKVLESENVSNVSVSSGFGTVSISSPPSTQTISLFSTGVPYPLSIVSKLRINRTHTIPRVPSSITGITAVESVAAYFGNISSASHLTNPPVAVRIQPQMGYISITRAPAVVKWKSHLVKPTKVKIRG